MPYGKGSTCLPRDQLPKCRVSDERYATPIEDHLISQPVVVNSCTDPASPLENIYCALEALNLRASFEENP